MNSRSYSFPYTDVNRDSKTKYTQAHFDEVDKDTKARLLKSDHFLKDPIGGAYMLKVVWIVLPGDVVPVCMNKCLIQFMKGDHNLSYGNSCRPGFKFGGSPSTTTMEAIDSAYGGGIQYGSNVKNVLCMNGRVGHCSISSCETNTCRCANLDKDENELRVKQLNFFEDAFRAKGAIGFYHSFAGEAAGVVRNIIDKLDIDPHQKSEDTYHLQHFSSEPVLCLSSRRQLDKCTKVMKGVSDRYERCCAVHAEDSGVSRAAGATTIIDAASASEKLLYVSTDPESWTRSEAWVRKASKRTKALWDRLEYRRKQRESWDKASRKDQQDEARGYG